MSVQALRWLADLLRGTVRCLFPLTMLALAALLLYSAQGRDVLRVLVEQNADDDTHRISGLVWLWLASAVLGLSTWYSLRWLLMAEMPGLPLRAEPGWLRRWLPRLLGAGVPALVALNLVTLQLPDGDIGAELRQRATVAGLWFGALALALLVALRLRGNLMDWLNRSGWLASNEGRSGAFPDVLGADARLPTLTRLTIGWTIGVTVLVALLIALFPVTLPRVIQSAAVALLALASINLVGSFLLTYWPLRSGLPILAPWVLLLGGLLGAVNDNHVVRPAAAVDPAAAQRAGLRPLHEDFSVFVGQTQSHAAPVLFVASEGGGIRAAYWAAAVMQELVAEIEPIDQRIYALSGVSGGSLGLATWLAVRRAALCPRVGTASPVRATDALDLDFVSPAVAGLLYYDLIQRFWPQARPEWDRSRAMEIAWQRALATQPGRPFEQTLDAFYGDCRQLPHLLLNATVVETGQRAILSLLDTREFSQGVDLMSGDYMTRYQSLAGLVHHSARFPLISPAGTVEQVAQGGTPLSEPVARLRLVDGGYYDNSGAETLIDLIRALANKPGAVKFRPVILLIENDARAARLSTEAAKLEPSRVFPEVGSVLNALLHARAAHASSAKTQVLAAFGCDVVRLPVREGGDAAQAPLGWALSETSRRAMAREAREVVAERADAIRARMRTDAPACATAGSTR